MSINLRAGNIADGLSTDTKPTNISEHALFLETDTKLGYLFDGSSWNDLGYLKLTGGTVSGDLTIESSTPTLSIKSALNGESRIRFLETTNYIGGYLYYEGDLNRFDIGVHDTANSLTSSDIPAISIMRADGRVGINTTTPSAGYSLDVSGDANYQDNLNIAGRVFINTSAPASPGLTISGTRPNIYMEATSSTTGGIAFSLMEAYATNTASSIRAQIGVIGLYAYGGGTGIDATPDPAYVYIDPRTDGTYSNATLKIDNDKVGIGITGTTRPSTTLDVRGDATFDGGTNTTVTILSDDTGESVLNLIGDGQGTGRVYVGQSLSTHGGGIEYNGDNVPTNSGAGLDYVTLYRRLSGTDYWTARNFYNSNDWEFRGGITSAGLTVNGDSSISGKLGLGITTTPNEVLEVKGNVLVRNPENNPALIISPSSGGYNIDPELYIQSAETGIGTGANFHISCNAKFQTSDDTYVRIDTSYSPSSIYFSGTSGTISLRSASSGTGAITWNDNLTIDGSTGDTLFRGDISAQEGSFTDLYSTGDLFANTSGKTAYFANVEIDNNLQISGVTTLLGNISAPSMTLTGDLTTSGNLTTSGGIYTTDILVPNYGDMGPFPSYTTLDIVSSDQNDVRLNLLSGLSSKILLNTNGDSYLNGGNVGIGTSSPSTLLHLEGSGSQSILLKSTSHATDYSVELDMNYSWSNPFNLKAYQGTSIIKSESGANKTSVNGVTNVDLQINGVPKLLTTSTKVEIVDSLDVGGDFSATNGTFSETLTVGSSSNNDLRVQPGGVEIGDNSDSWASGMVAIGSFLGSTQSYVLNSSQSSIVNLANNTTSNSITYLYESNGSNLIISSNKTVFINIKAMAVSNETKDIAVWDLNVIAQRTSAGLSIVKISDATSSAAYSPGVQISGNILDESMDVFKLAFSAAGVQLRVGAYGGAGESVNWNATLYINEINGPEINGGGAYYY